MANSTGGQTLTEEMGGIKPSTTPTRTPETELQYKKVVQRLMLNVESNQSEPTIENIALFFGRISSSLSKSSVRQYRSAIINHIEQQIEKGFLIPSDAMPTINLLQMIKGKSDPSTKSSSLKSKHINELLLTSLVDRLSKSRSRIAMLAKNMFQSSVMTGLRPSEWAFAKIEKNMLVVKNGKATNGRATGEFRHINLSDPVLQIDTKKMAIIERTIGEIHSIMSEGKDMTSLISDIAQLIKRHRITTGGKYVTIYTARHQFAANMKIAGLSRREIADLMGHASSTTAALHYGKKISGHLAFKSASQQHNLVEKL